MENPVPKRYEREYNGNKAEASRRWRETCKWRRDNKVDDVIRRPQPFFYALRECFPVYVHGRSRTGLPVLWEQIGRVNLSRGQELGLSLSDIHSNYVFINECVWRVVLDQGEDDDNEAQFITVEDVAGVGFSHLTLKVLSIFQSLTSTMKNHYTGRCYKTYIINAPVIFTTIYQMVSHMLSASTRSKVTVLGADYAASLAEEIDSSETPAEYGGTSGRSLPDCEDDRKIQTLVARLNGVSGSSGAAAGP